MDEGDQVFPQDQSAALVVLEFPSFRDFIDAYSPIISEQGIFIRDADVAQSNAFAVGDRIDFEVRLKDDFRLVQGSGEVVRLGTEEAVGSASGAAVRFLEIDEPSQRLISRLVNNHVRDGGKLFDVGGSMADEAPAASEDLVEDSDAAEAALTAETLKASEADALFAVDDGAEAEIPVEFETVSPAEIESAAAELPSSLEIDAAADLELPADSEPAAPDLSSGLDAPVGLETIAIPSGLVAAVSEGEGERIDELDLPAADQPVAEDFGETAEEHEMFEPTDATEVEESIDLPPGADSVLADTDSAEDTFDPVAAMEGSSLEAGDLGVGPDDESLEAATESLEAELGARVGIPDEIAQVAEELSGVDRFDPPAGEVSGSALAGSASAKSDSNVGGRIAALVVVATLLGATAYYFGDTIMGWFGLGAENGATAVASIEAGETMGGAVEAPEAPVVATTETVGAVADSQEAPAGTVDTPVDSVTPEDPAEVPAAEVPAEEVPAEEVTTAVEEPVEVAEQPGASIPATAEETQPLPQPASAQVERKVENISWKLETDSTVVTIRLNTAVSAAYFEVARVQQGSPREVLKIRDVSSPYVQEIAVGTDQLIRLRTGLHRDAEGSALHIVADLAGSEVKIRSVEPRGNNLELTFQ